MRRRPGSLFSPLALGSFRIKSPIKRDAVGRQVAERLVEGEHSLIFHADQKIELWSAMRPTPGLRSVHQRPTNTATTIGGINTEIIEGATMTIMTGHGGSNQVLAIPRHKDGCILRRLGQSHVGFGIVPRPRQTAPNPKCDDRFSFCTRHLTDDNFPFDAHLSLPSLAEPTAYVASTAARRN